MTEQAAGGLVDVGDAMLHVESSGLACGPVVVVETGHDELALGWLRLVELVPHLRVLTYDRPGYGLSSLATGPVDAKSASRRLERLLTALGVNRPVILVGHSAGALRVLCLAAEFPERVAALVLVDPSVPQPTVLLRACAMLRLARRASQLVFLRLAASGPHRRRCLPPSGAVLPGRFDPTLHHVIADYFTSSQYLRAVLAESRAMSLGRRQAAAAVIADDLPVVVVTRAHPADQRPSIQRLLDRVCWSTLYRAHTDLAKRSARGMHLTCAHSGHSVHVDEPEILAASVCHAVRLAGLDPRPRRVVGALS